MTTKLVPDDLFMKHENEWQAVRQIAENHVSTRSSEIRSIEKFVSRDRTALAVGSVATAG